MRFKTDAYKTPCDWLAIPISRYIAIWLAESAIFQVSVWNSSWDDADNIGSSEEVFAEFQIRKREYYKNNTVVLVRMFNPY